ncbi:MAG: Ku protein [Rhodospirillaceae bacterium]|nr:Ku protein [Rhodospirillaceae bacterium]
MALRAYWKGHLRLSLVSCPVALYSALSRSGRVSFHLLHGKTHNRVQMRPHDPELGEVDRSDLVKGYEYEKGKYVVLSEEELEKVRIESSQAIVIERFVDPAQLDPIYFDTPYYLAPDGAAAVETYSVLHRAMREEKKVALSRLVLATREHPVAIAVHDRGFMLSTLRAADEVHDARPYFAEIEDVEPDAEMLTLAKQLIRQKSGKLDLSTFRDRYQDALRELIEAKIAGQEPVVAEAPEYGGKVIDLMEALKRSLKGEGGAPQRKPPAQSRPTRRAAASRQSKPKAKAAGGRRR